MSIDERAFSVISQRFLYEDNKSLRRIIETYEAAKPEQPASCDDEGCPHYNTPHSHGKALAEQPVGYAALVCDVEEYLHWRKVNPQIKGGENYLKRFRQSLASPKRVFRSE